MSVRAMLCALALISAAAAHAEGNRYKYPREYKADISPVVAQRILANDRAAVLVDVRSIEEFVAGHVPGADHIPYPRVKGKDKAEPGYLAMSPEDFLAEVSARHPDKSTPILTMCASGGRSAMAANILAKAGYSNVSSVWTGYSGLPLKDVDGNPLDINGNGIIHGVTMGSDGKPAQDPGDLDGWAGFNDLPTTTALDAARVLDRFRAHYPAATP